MGLGVWGGLVGGHGYATGDQLRCVLSKDRHPSAL